MSSPTRESSTSVASGPVLVENPHSQRHPTGPGGSPLHPGMVYLPPVSPPSPTRPLLNPDDDDDGGVRKPIKIRLHLVNILRFLAAILTFIGCIIVGTNPQYYGKYKNPVLVFASMAICWNAFLLVAHFLVQTKAAGGLPACMCQCGPIKLSCGGGRDLEVGYEHVREDGREDNGGDEGGNKKKKHVHLAWIIDGFLAFFLLLFSCLYWANINWYYRTHDGATMFAMVLFWITFGLLVIIIFAQHFRVFRGLTIFIRVDDEDEDEDRRKYQIRLPRDATPKNVSIVA